MDLETQNEHVGVSWDKYKSLELSHLPEPPLSAEVVISLLPEKAKISSHEDPAKTNLANPVTVQSKVYSSQHPPKLFADSRPITRDISKHIHPSKGKYLMDCEISVHLYWQISKECEF